MASGLDQPTSRRDRSIASLGQRLNVLCSQRINVIRGKKIDSLCCQPSSCLGY